MQGNTIVTAKVLKVMRKTYHVAVERRIIHCLVRGKIVMDDSENKTVRVGDDVKVRLVSDTEGVIEEILPRRSWISRTIESRAYQEQVIATNIDQVLIILSARHPAFKSGLMDRYLVIAERNRLKARICINKIDLASPKEFAPYREYYQKLGYPVLLTSAVSGKGLSALKKILKNSVTALVGHSGVGKSSLIKAIEPELDIKVTAISKKFRKGQHTTSSVQLFPLSFGGYVVDTPGIRELGFWDIYKRDLQNYFVEFRQLASTCQFADCQHLQEPGCAVKAAVEKGEIFRERYLNYLNIYTSLRAAHYE